MNRAGRRYVSSPKHGPGGWGSICPPWSHELAQELLDESEPHPQGKKARYATRNGLAFEAYPDNQGGWHGYPVGWHEVPPSLTNGWLKKKLVRRRDVRKYGFLQTDERGHLVD